MLAWSGYSDSPRNDSGRFALHPDSVEIFPGPKSYFDAEPGVVMFSLGKIEKIVSLLDNTEHREYRIEPALITNLARQKRRPVRFEEVPKILVNAVISAEDKRFFQHAGIHPLRVPGYLLRGFAQPASDSHSVEAPANSSQGSLTVALANLLWPNSRPGFWPRAGDLITAAILEQRLTKQEIFESYANEVYLGRRGSFTIIGFGEAAYAYFGKALKELTLPEAATLAGMARQPDLYDPLRFPDRLRARRNVVLTLMRENGFIADGDFALGSEVPLAPREKESEEAPHFADLVNDWLQSHEGYGLDFRTHRYRVFTTLEPNLQLAAVTTVHEGLREADAAITSNPLLREYPSAQAALVALDPSTGSVKALVGGRDYQDKQANHAVSEFQPGAAFLPFDFAAALETTIAGASLRFTLATTLNDEPGKFLSEDRLVPIPEYDRSHRGKVAFRDALANLLAAPALSVAEAVGVDNVLALTRRSGLYPEGSAVGPTSSLALGFEKVSPLELAGAFTTFANSGVFAKPNMIKLIRDETGRVVFKGKDELRQALDPRIAYLVTDTLKAGLSGGDAKPLLSNFIGPAAVVTGRSRDAWCVGFTTRLLVVVWVGYDDNREIPPDGATSALRIFSAFMNRVSKLMNYGNAPDFVVPSGIVFSAVDRETRQRATGSCPAPSVEPFVAGTELVEVCHVHHGTVLPLTSSPNSRGTASTTNSRNLQ